MTHEGQHESVSSFTATLNSTMHFIYIFSKHNSSVSHFKYSNNVIMEKFCEQYFSIFNVYTTSVRHSNSQPKFESVDELQSLQFIM